MSNTSSYLKAVFVTRDAGQAELLIALLSDAGFEGFQEASPLLEAYAPLEQADRQRLEAISRDTGIPYKEEVLPATNWNAEWEKAYQPVLVGAFCCIRAAFHPAVIDVRHDIIITPKMSFGTGHHATTYLMIKALEGVDMVGKEVLDFGTGTGVLAILAEKSGARRIEAIDCDEWSVENARENIADNGCSRIVVRKADDLSNAGRYGIMLANINKNVILSQLESMAQHLEPGGLLLISGVLNNDQLSVISALENCSLQITSVLEREGWIMISSCKP